jgi:hypothetical protein
MWAAVHERRTEVTVDTTQPETKKGSMWGPRSMAGVPDGRCHVERRLAELALAGEGWDG